MVRMEGVYRWDCSMFGTDEGVAEAIKGQLQLASYSITASKLMAPDKSMLMQLFLISQHFAKISPSSNWSTRIGWMNHKASTIITEKFPSQAT